LELTITESGSGVDVAHPLFQVFKPKQPTFTVLSLVNALENALIANGDNYLILVDQISEKVQLTLYPSFSDASGRLTAAIGNPSSTFGGSTSLVAVFDTTFEAPSAGVPSFGWE
jgi:hypothetical protein